MIRIAGPRRNISWWLVGCFRLSIVFATMLMLLLPASAQQSQPFHLISAGTDNSTSVKGAAGQVVTVVAINTTATIYYLKFYDIASAPTCSTGVKLTFPVPANNSSTGGGFVISIPEAASFLNGIGICLVGGIADNDDSNAATGVAIDVFFK